MHAPPEKSLLGGWGVRNFYFGGGGGGGGGGGLYCSGGHVILK